MEQHPQLHRLQNAIHPLRQQLVNHPVYTLLTNADAVASFMESHAFAVWDFMSLLKSLQMQLTAVSVPWVPVGSASTRFLINEIVVGEESDVDPNGGFISHYELYLRAMKQAGADTRPITQLVASLQAGEARHAALINCGAPEWARAFTENTLSIAMRAPVGVVAAVFTFGREDLIPAMFVSMLDQLNAKERERLSVFRYYLERHIEVDGDHHSHLAPQMTQELLGQDEAAWQQATEAVKLSLSSRISLWNGVMIQLEQPAMA